MSRISFWSLILLIRLHGVLVVEYQKIINTKYFIINSKIAALWSCNRSVVLTYICIHTNTRSCLLEWRWDTQTDTHAWSPAHIHKRRASLTHFHECLSYIHKVAVYWRVESIRHTYIYPQATVIPEWFGGHSYPWRVPFFHLQESYLYTHVALHATCTFISLVWDESS